MGNGQLTYLGHSALRLTLADGRVLLIDPWLRENPSCPDAQRVQQRCDFVFLTHGHADHVGDVAELVAQHNPLVLAAYELSCLLSARHPRGRFEGMGIGGTVQRDGVRISMTRAYHSSSFQEQDRFLYAGVAAGVVVAVHGLATVYHAGDTDVFGDMQLIAEMHQPRVLLLPIGDHYTMGPRGAARAARYFEPSAIVPMHYGTFPMLHGTPAALREALGPPLAGCVLALEPGASAVWTAQGLTRAG